MIDKVVAFIEAQLDEDERVACAATSGPWTDCGTQPYGVEQLGGDQPRYVAQIETGDDREAADAEHIARHDPARGLREVEAIRRVLTQYRTVCDEVREPHSTDHYAHARSRQYQLQQVLLVLAAVWADHGDYDPAWVPDVDG